MNRSGKSTVNNTHSIANNNYFSYPIKIKNPYRKKIKLRLLILRKSSISSLNNLIKTEVIATNIYSLVVFDHNYN